LGSQFGAFSGPSLGVVVARNIDCNHALLDLALPRSAQQSEGAMATKQNGQIVESATEARQAEPGPSVLALLTMSTGLAVLLMAVIWFVFFRT
jgi:hypothetical protein